ncbi:MAG: PAS domain-containing protein [Thermodesulfobacteriota bacterium]
MAKDPTTVPSPPPPPFSTAILDTLADGVLITDRDCTITYANRAAAPAAVVGRKCHEVSHQYPLPCDSDCLAGAQCPIRQVLASGRPAFVRHRHPQPDGSTRTFSITASPLTDGTGEIRQVIQVLKDVTDQKKTETALQESLARYRNLFEESPLPLIVADFSAIKTSLTGFGFPPSADIAAYCTSHPDMVAALLQQLRLIDFNRAALRLLGIPDKTQAFANLDRILASIPLHETPEGLVAIARGEVQYSHPFSIRSMSGVNLSCTVHWQVEPGYEHSYGRVLLSLVDHTERAKAEAELRLLRGRLHDAAENERRRLARELHDDVGQKLAALGINLHLLRTTRGVADPERFHARLDDSVQMVEEMVGQVRSVMTELRPPLLDDYGLLACLQWLGRRFADRTDVAITVTGEEPRPRLASARETAIYRIAQEALTNAVRHAGARRISLSLLETGDSLLLKVEDDGRGFDPEATPGQDADAGLGLVGMRERAELLHARLRIDSSPGKGTTVTLRVAR